MLKQIAFILSISVMNLFCHSQVQAEIIETREIVDILGHIHSAETLVLFNITGTLYEPATTLADNQWRLYFNERVNQAGIDPVIGERLRNKVCNMIVHQVPKKPVEPYTPFLISGLQLVEIPVLGITKKGLTTPYADDFGFVTSQHLLTNGISLQKTLSYFQALSENTDLYTFAYGIIFTEGKPVGPSIVSFLERNPHSIPHVVMVDNSRGSLENTEIALKSIGVAFTGIKYTAAQARKENFDPILGTIEFAAFIEEGRIMPDDEAMAIKLANPDIDYVDYLDNLIINMAYDDSIGA